MIKVNESERARIVRYLENINNNIVMEIYIYVSKGMKSEDWNEEKEDSNSSEYSAIFLQRGWPSGRIRSTHRSGGRAEKNVAGRGCSRTRGRGRSLKISIRDFHSNERGERRSRRTAKRLSISCKSTGHRWKRRANTSARPLLVIKMLTPAVGLPKCTGYCGFFEHLGGGNARLFTKISVSECLFSFFSSCNIAPRAYEKPSSIFLLYLFFFSRRISINDSESNVSSVLCDLFLVTLENLETWLRYVNVRDDQKNRSRFDRAYRIK